MPVFVSTVTRLSARHPSIALFKKTKSALFSNQNLKKLSTRSVLPDVQIEKLLLHEYVFKNLDRWHSRIALESVESGRKYTYSDVYRKSRALAVFLRKRLKLSKGDSVCFMSLNVPEYPIGMLAVYQAGLVATTMNPIYTEEEIVRQLLDSKTKAVFTLTEFYPQVKNAIAKVQETNIPVIIMKQTQQESLVRGAINFEETVSDYDSSFLWDKPRWEDVAILPYSSGTTGMPKGVELTHQSVVSNLCQWLSPDVGILNKLDETHQDVIPYYLPMFHIYGIMVLTLSVLSTGGKLLTVTKFGSQVFLNILEEHKPDVLFAVPPIVLLLLNNPNVKKRHVEGIRTVCSSAAPLGAADVERFVEKTDGAVDLLQMYGMTEASPLVLAQTKSKPNGIKIGGSGFLVPNTECKIVDISDESNTGLGPNKSGELLISGPQVMKGYHKNEKATKETIVDGGWLRTGDIGHYDEDGHFFITDRLKELIKVKGFQVAPAELEEILRDHPSVEDAAVVGIPHKDFGEVPKAFVVAKNNARITQDAICEFVAQKVAKYKQLTGGVVFLDNIPKNPSGKILRRVLKTM